MIFFIWIQPDCQVLHNYHGLGQVPAEVKESAGWTLVGAGFDFIWAALGDILRYTLYVLKSIFACKSQGSVHKYTLIYTSLPCTRNTQTENIF